MPVQWTFGVGAASGMEMAASAGRLSGVIFISLRIMQTMQSDVDAGGAFMRGWAHGKEHLKCPMTNAQTEKSAALAKVIRARVDPATSDCAGQVARERGLQEIERVLGNFEWRVSSAVCRCRWFFDILIG